MRLMQIIKFASAAIVLAVGAGSTGKADDLANLAGNWATSQRACEKWKSGGFETTGDGSGQIMNITGNTITWSRGGCMLTDALTTAGAITAKSDCERRGNTGAGTMKITLSSQTRIIVDADRNGYSGTFVKCDCKPKSADDFLGCH